MPNIGRQGNNDAEDSDGLDQSDDNTNVINGQHINANEELSHDVDNNESSTQLGSKVKKIRKAKHSVVGLVDMLARQSIN
eukprot:9581811-Ditylum_brightwellii.AAC.1